MSAQRDDTSRNHRDNDHGVVIVGAGLSGLVAAQHLAHAQIPCTIVEATRAVGGRLSTREHGAARLDLGAQFFTTRSAVFTDTVERWVTDGIAAVWCHGFGEPDGYPRYRIDGGMHQLAQYLLGQLDPDIATLIRRARVDSVMSIGDCWALSFDGATHDPLHAAAVILTPPVPESLTMTDRGAVTFEPGIDSVGLRSMQYHRVIAVAVITDRPADLGAAGARQQPADPFISFIADNSVKGISPEPAVTVHLSHDYSEQLWDRSDAEVLTQAREPIAAALGDVQIRHAQIRRWRYAGPVTPSPEPCLLAASRPGPLIFAGDAFGGAKVEGAFLSGRAAAQSIIDQQR